MFEEVASLIVENFVATYQKDGENTLIMCLPNGQQFKISVEEMQQKNQAAGYSRLIFTFPHNTSE